MVLAEPHSVTFANHSTSRFVYALFVLLLTIAFTSLCVAWAVREQEKGSSTELPPLKQLLVVDTDPGIDDAVALLTALGDQRSRVLGVTCVRGNTDVPNVIVNAFKILTVAGKNKVPVFNSFNLGLVESPASDNWFGQDGLGDLPFADPPSPARAQKEHSATFLARIVRDNPGKITVVALGPLTNLALALHLNPNFLKQARRIIILGGSIRGLGNAAPGIEFNFFMDPSAASVVLDQALASGRTITLIPMETVTENELTMDWRWNSLGKINNSVVSFLNQLERRQQELHPSKEEYHPFDTYAMSVALNEDTALSSRKLYGFVENKGQRTNGALVVDYLNVTGKAANLEIIMDVDKALIKKTMYNNFSNFK